RRFHDVGGVARSRWALAFPDATSSRHAGPETLGRRSGAHAADDAEPRKIKGHIEEPGSRSRVITRQSKTRRPPPGRPSESNSDPARTSPRSPNSLRGPTAPRVAGGPAGAGAQGIRPYLDG